MPPPPFFFPAAGLFSRACRRWRCLPVRFPRRAPQRSAEYFGVTRTRSSFRGASTGHERPGPIGPAVRTFTWALRLPDSPLLAGVDAMKTTRSPEPIAVLTGDFVTRRRPAPHVAPECCWEPIGVPDVSRLGQSRPLYRPPQIRPAHLEPRSVTTWAAHQHTNDRHQGADLHRCPWVWMIRRPAPPRGTPRSRSFKGAPDSGLAALCGAYADRRAASCPGLEPILLCLCRHTHGGQDVTSRRAEAGSYRRFGQPSRRRPLPGEWQPALFREPRFGFWKGRASPAKKHRFRARPLNLALRVDAPCSQMMWPRVRSAAFFKSRPRI